MSGETESSVSGWTTDTLHSQLQLLMEERDKRYEASLEAVVGMFNTRIAAIDKATDKFEANLVRVPTDVDKQVEQLKILINEMFRGVYQRFDTTDEKHAAMAVEMRALKELHAEKFDSVALQFKERDTRSERESRDNKVAVDAAFAAQKEAASEQNKSNTLAIDKSEKATAETLNKQADLFKSTTDALDDKINAGKEVDNKLDTRLTAIESRGVVVRETQGQSNWLIGTVIGILAVLISLAGLIVVLVKVG